jgi:hypothetical protein
LIYTNKKVRGTHPYFLVPTLQRWNAYCDAPASLFYVNVGRWSVPNWVPTLERWNHKIIIEYDEEHHLMDAHIIKDDERDKTLILLGYTVVRIKKHESYGAAINRIFILNYCWMHNLFNHKIGYLMLVNPTLIEAGLQTSHRDHKDRLCYELTEKGLEYGLYLDTGKKHGDGSPVRQIKWYASVVDVLKAHLGASFVLTVWHKRISDTLTCWRGQCGLIMV